MQNLARVWSTLKFDGEYLWNEWIYSKLVSKSFDSDFARVRQNKYGEGRSSEVTSEISMFICTHRKRIIRKNIFQLLEGAALQHFYTR